jgi:GT2 family glycosyltransferase
LNTLSCATFFRRSIVEHGLLFDPAFRAIGDAVWVHQLLANGARMAVLREPLSVFTFTGENLGAAAKSHDEMLRWRRASDAPPAFLQLPAILHHRLKKFLAGAYLPRSCSIEIYTLDSTDVRRHFFMPRIGFSWPHSDAASPQPGFSGVPPSVFPPSATLKVFAVFTSFNRSAIALHCLDHLLRQTRKPDRIIVADNSSSDGTVGEIRNRYGGDPLVELLKLPKNIGNSGGIRIAMQRALSEGAGAVWILDDDSWPRPESLEKLLAHYNETAVFSSLVFDPEHQDISWPYMVSGPKNHLAGTLNSLPECDLFEVRGAWLGALVSRRILETAGLPDERLFIRGEDEEFPLRIKKHGFHFFCVKDSVLEHPSPQRLIRLHLFGVNFFYEPRLAVWKAYYMVRNRVFIYRKYSRNPLEGVAKATCSVFLAVCIALLRDDQKMKRVLVYFRAGWHGMTNQIENRAIPNTPGF